MLKSNMALSMQNNHRAFSKEILCQMCFLEGESIGPYTHCQECAQVMCDHCTFLHEKTPEFASHHLHIQQNSNKKKNLCLKHSRSVSHFCRCCTSGVCIDCMLSDDHTDHNDDITDISTGLVMMREELAMANEDIPYRKNIVDNIIVRANRDLGILSEMKCVLNCDLENSRKKCQELEDRINELENIYQRPILNFVEELNVIKQEIQILSADNSELMKADDQVLTKRFHLLRSKLHSSITKVEELSSKTYHMPSNPSTSNQADRENKPIGIKLLFSLASIKGEHLVLPWQILALDYDCAAVVDGSLKQVLRLSKSGSLITKYYHQRQNSQYLQSVGEYNNCAYMADEKEIYQLPMCFPSTERIRSFRPAVGQISKILVVDETNIIITDGQSDGKIYKYNKLENTTQILVEGLRRPTYLSVANTSSSVRYIVSEEEMHQIRIYDEHWQLQTTIGGHPSNKDGEFSYPCATATTPSGALLVADSHNHRVSMFDLRGGFVEHVLSMKDGIKYPVGLACCHPFLWVTSTVDVSVKCFQIS